MNDFTGKSYLKAYSNEIESFEQHYIGPFNAKCEFCNSINFKIEAVKKQFTMCCNKGSINITPFKPIPEEMKDLFTGKILTSV